MLIGGYTALALLTSQAVWRTQRVYAGSATLLNASCSLNYASGLRWGRNECNEVMLCGRGISAWAQPCLAGLATNYSCLPAAFVMTIVGMCLCLCRQKNFNISSLCQRPNKRILSVSTSSHSNDIAPLARNEHAKMSLGLMLCCGSCAAASRNNFVTSVAVTYESS